MNQKHILPLLFIFPALFLLVTAQPAIIMVSASDQSDLTDTLGEGDTAIQQNGGEGEIQCIMAPCPGDEDNDEEQQTPPQQTPPTGQGQTTLGQQNEAESNQVGGIGAGKINQQAQGSVNEQLCNTVGGIGNRQCQQSATPGASNLQDCTAIAGLGKANCVQSENPNGPDNCLTANGRPFICETSTGRSLSGSGQAGQ
jgi:hypothetical protein